MQSSFSFKKKFPLKEIIQNKFPLKEIYQNKFPLPPIFSNNETEIIGKYIKIF
jgi:hypothetical protein